MANPNKQPLDVQQVLAGAFDSVEERLRVDAEVSAVLGTVECVIDASSGDNIAISNGIDTVTLSSGIGGKVGLDVNVITPINVSPTAPVGASLQLLYDEITNLASGTTSNIISYTVPSGTAALLQKVYISGGNIAKYQLKINGTVVATARTYFGGELNTDFDFLGQALSGQVLLAGNTVEVTVNNFRPTSADFETTLQIVEIT